jgi:hypothetical protein
LKVPGSCCDNSIMYVVLGMLSGSLVTIYIYMLF